MRKLIGMTDFVLETIADRSGSNTLDYREYAYNKLLKIENYANFLKQPLTLGMFVPCDLEGNVLEEPKPYNSWLKNWQKEEGFEDCEVYRQAKERCLFDGFEIVPYTRSVIKNNYVIDLEYASNATIEDLTKHECDLQLTPTALKLLGL